MDNQETPTAPEAKNKRFLPNFSAAQPKKSKTTIVQSPFVGFLSTSQARPANGAPVNAIDVYMYPEAIKLQDGSTVGFPSAFWDELEALKSKHAKDLGGVVVGGPRSGASGTRITANRFFSSRLRKDVFLNAGFMAAMTRLFNEATGSKILVPVATNTVTEESAETETTTIADGEVAF